ncbi:hypothetical protein KJ708_02435 [bacterium]|nr:hypothetical protein [bacterium]MBU1917750.1 hypothetical protein [bacterium]
MTKPISGNPKPLDSVEQSIDKTTVKPETTAPTATPAEGAEVPKEKPAQPQVRDEVVPQEQVEADERARELAGEADVVSGRSGVTGAADSSYKKEDVKAEITSILKTRFAGLCREHNISPGDLKLSINFEYSTDGLYAHATVDMENSNFNTPNSVQAEIVNQMNRTGGRILQARLQQSLGMTPMNLEGPTEGVQIYKENIRFIF